MRELFIFLVISLFIGGIIIGTGMMSVQLHEKAHQQINKYYGADSHVVLNYFGTSYTILDENFSSAESQRMAYLGHSVNEAIGYQLTPYFMSIMILFFVVILIGVAIVFELQDLNRGCKR